MFGKTKEVEKENYDVLDEIEIFDDPADMKKSRKGERVRLSKDKKRSYLTILISLAAVLAASSCILILLLINSSNKRQEVSAAKDTEMAEKLGQIEEYLTSIDTKVADDSVSVTNADNYKQLSTTVDSLKNNLTQYRDDNDITNDEIGSNLDDVITQLGKIQTDLDKRRDEEKTEGNELDSRLDNITESSRQAEDSLSSDLSRVHESISSLIEKTGEDQTGNYLELKGILAATDSNFSDLVSDRFNAQGQLIEEKTGQLDRDINGVRNDISSVRNEVNGSLGTVDSAITAMSQTVNDNMDSLSAANEQMSENIVTINDNLASVNDGVLEKLDINSEYIREIENRVSELKTAMDEEHTVNEERLDGIQSTVESGSEKSDILEKKVDELSIRIEEICKKMGISVGEEAGDGTGTETGNTKNPDAGDTKNPDAGNTGDSGNISSDQSVIF